MYNHQLDTFIKTAQLGSFGKAANALYISVPAVIQQINLLEEHYGFRLFLRSNRGVVLTPAGRSLYEDAKTLIRFSHDALNRARSLAVSSETTVRIGTSLLFKCRLLPSIWSNICTHISDLKMEIYPMAEHQERQNIFSLLGNTYDLWEGVYASNAWQNMCCFLELLRVPLCCAVSPNHRFADKKLLSMDDFQGETVIMPIANVSKEIDVFRSRLQTAVPTCSIVDSFYYGMDTFTTCEVSQSILLTQSIYADIHTNLITIPLDTDITLPYGLIYAKSPTSATQKFITAVKQYYLD